MRRGKAELEVELPGHSQNQGFAVDQCPVVCGNLQREVISFHAHPKRIRSEIVAPKKVHIGNQVVSEKKTMEKK